MNSKQCVVIAIAGASASGKSLIAKTIYEELCRDLGTDQIGVIAEDAYYRDQGHMSMDERVLTNYDHPKALDHELLCKHLRALKEGNAVDIPVYSYNEHTRTDEKVTLTPKKVIILEGILLLTDPALREQMDASVFMDTPLDICFMRRLSRDVAERGRTMESVMAQYTETVRPMFLQFIEPSKQYADIIVPRGGKNRIATDILKARIQHLLVK
ncbi:uridine kinase [Shewanella sp. Choline-02u-19]|jgi:uridine kinase|uniref:uridine kinase n=1 Tax=unclassified Shewanella TaxID=196818 RepID=UPI000C31FF4F|nr:MULTISPECIES: uridine kinase [unclassified Shewanella]PKG58279.1 uridine kinase [Shewanella sp. GutDb-MelDb]PKG72675.1 uridine kinase [Shewanella sp. GutCb]PKH56945.1 uridine kinase [Shewanella sp. Bg11-22]PKI27742.1 uridine kinase [Shewanella sp. Choline-02u-19]